MASTPPVRVIAHRGASDDVPEHTLAAYRKAIADGADGLECDVRLTRDGHLVCVHDARVDRTSDGRGRVSSLELADLAELDFSAWPRRRGRAPGWQRSQREPESEAEVDDTARDAEEEPDRDATGVLTLAMLLELVVDCPRPVELAVETKHPTRYAGLVEQRLVELLGRFGQLPRRADDQQQVRVMSFSRRSLRRVHALAPGLPTVLLLQWVPPALHDGALPAQVGIVGPSLELVRRSPGYVARVHAAGHAVHVWTVDEDDDLRYMRELDVDAVITNRPRRALELLR